MLFSKLWRPPKGFFRPCILWSYFGGTRKFLKLILFRNVTKYFWWKWEIIYAKKNRQQISKIFLKAIISFSNGESFIQSFCCCAQCNILLKNFPRCWAFQLQKLWTSKLQSKILFSFTFLSFARCTQQWPNAKLIFRVHFRFYQKFNFRSTSGLFRCNSGQNLDQILTKVQFLCFNFSAIFPPL